MRKFIIPALGLAALAATGLFFCDCSEDQSLPEEKAAYISLFNEKKSEILLPEEVAKLDKKHSPDQFYEFDKLKRMDPVTGEVPANALMKAWQEITSMFGEIPASDKGSGYGLTWEERGPTNIGGRTRAALFDPADATGKRVFAGGVGGGLWKTDDITVSSPTWTNVSPVFSNVAVTAIAADPANPAVMYYGTGEGYFNADALRGAGIWKSTDGGNSWRLLPATDTSAFYYCHRIQVTANRDVYIASKSGLWKSTDQGTSFTKVLGQGTGLGSDWITDLEITGDGDLFAGIGGGGIYRSLASLGATQGDAGSWTRLNANLGSNFDRVELAACQSNPDVLYAVAEINQGTGNVIKSINGGNSWSNTSSQPAGGSDYSNGQAWYDLALEVDPTNPDLVFTGGLHIYGSTNGGASWTRRTAGGGSGSLPYVHVDQHGVYFNPVIAQDVLFTNDGGLWYSTDNGISFDSKNTGYNVTQFYSLSVDPRPSADIIIGGTQDNGSMLVQGSGTNAATGLTGADGSFCAINYDFPDTMYTTYQYQTVLRSRNGGGNFTSISNPNLSNQDVLFINPLEIDVNDPDLLYQASTALWRHGAASFGGGAAWTQATKDLNTAITAISSAPTQPYLCYFASGGTIYRLPFVNTTNQSTNPQSVNAGGNGAGYVSCIAVNPSDENHIIITYSSYNITQRVLECRDANLGAGATWKDLTGNLPNMPINWAVFEPNNNDGVVLGTDLGIFRSGDITVPSSQVWWMPERRGMGCPRVDMLEVRAADNSVHAATHGRGFFSTYSYNQAPVAAFGLDSDSTCGGFTQFVDSSSNVPNAWAWDFGDGTTSTTQSPFHQYAASGNYTVTLTVTNPNGTNSTSQNVTITVLPSPVANAGPDLGSCRGDSIQLSASGGVAYSWEPTFGLDNPNSATPMLNLVSDRLMVVTVTNAEGCQDTDTVRVTAYGTPNLWAGPDKTITMPNDSAQLTASGADTYSWSPTTGLSCTNCPDPKAYPGISTTYTVTGLTVNGCSATDNVRVNVNVVSIEDGLDDEGNGLVSVSPSPFVEETRVSYQMGKAAPVQLTVSDVQGRIVDVVNVGTRPAGTHFIDWRPADAGVSNSGIYFFRLAVGDREWVRKAIWTK